MIANRGANLMSNNFSANPSLFDPTAISPETQKFRDAYLPSGIDLRDPDVSPLYADLTHLPSALFTVGTLDPLLDDSLFLSMRWLAAGNEAELAVYPGAPHAFNSLPLPQGPQANARIEAFLERRLS